MGLNPLIRMPANYEDAVKTFGNPVGPDGNLDTKWALENIVHVPFPMPLPLAWAKDQRASAAQCHRHVSPFLRAAFCEIDSNGLWHLITEYGGGFNFRKQRGSERLSTHAFGIALDLNPSTNKMGTKGDMPREIIDVLEYYGFRWGGRFTHRPDPMHFQFASSF